MSDSGKSKQSHYSEKIDSREVGRWASGITNPEMQALFGSIIGDWVHVEEAVIDLLDLLIFPDADIQLATMKRARGFLPGQQIFRAINSNNTRAKVMLALLNHYPSNDKKKLDGRYEAVISEFQSLSNARNDYLHGLWWTKSDGNVYLQTENVELSIFNKKRRIPQKDFDRFIERCNALERAIEALRLKEYRASGEWKAELAKRTEQRPKSQ
jgi:hypothetical protein